MRRKQISLRVTPEAPRKQPDRLSTLPTPTVGFLADPLFIVGTGRCGSTMLSRVVRHHPEVLSVSEFFTSLGSRAFLGWRPSGEAVFRRLETLPPKGRAFLESGLTVGEFLYEFGPESRYRPHSIPPILGATLPHLSDEAESTWDELGPALRCRGRETLAKQYRFVFEWLAHRFRQVLLGGALRGFAAFRAHAGPDVSRRQVRAVLERHDPARHGIPGRPSA